MSHQRRAGECFRRPTGLIALMDGSSRPAKCRAVTESQCTRAPTSCGSEALAKAGFVAEKPGGKARVRFVRDPDGVVDLRVDESSDGLAVGRAEV